MKWLQEISRRSSIAGQLFTFLWEQRLWWLVPFVVMLLLFTALLIVAQSTPLAPFIYTLF